jgi:hypothetical protein
MLLFIFNYFKLILYINDTHSYEFYSIVEILGIIYVGFEVRIVDTMWNSRY